MELVVSLVSTLDEEDRIQLEHIAKALISSLMNLTAYEEALSIYGVQLNSMSDTHRFTSTLALNWTR